jgi:glycosyltransferase involved in cell wall biosynthesis
MPERRGKRPTLVVDLTALGTPGGVRGIGRYIRELAVGLSELPEGELGDIELVGLTSIGWHGEHTTTRDFASIGDPSGTAPTNTDYYSWAYRQRLSLFRALRRLGADAVHITDPHATPLLLRPFGVQKLVTCHDLVPTRFPAQYMSRKDFGPVVGKWIERRRYTSADMVLAVSDATRHDVVSLLSVGEERVVRVHNGADVQRWATPPATPAEPTLRRFGLHERPFALYVGGSDYRKNVEGMLGGLLSARARGSDLDLAWAGNLQPKHRATVAEKIAAAGATDHVRLLGFVTDEELAVLYRSALAHLFVSRLEGFGYTVVEAMASGCPVITTRGGSLGEVAGDAALQVDAEDHAAIGDALHRLAHDPTLRNELSLKGRERAPRFSRLAQARGTAAVYRRLLSASSRG